MMAIAVTIGLIAIYCFLVVAIVKRRATPPRTGIFLLSGTIVAVLRISVLIYLWKVLHLHYMDSPVSFLRYLLLPEPLLFSGITTNSSSLDFALYALSLIAGSYVIVSPLLILVKASTGSPGPRA
jgi:hypothetical protein